MLEKPGNNFEAIKFSKRCFDKIFKRKLQNLHLRSKVLKNITTLNINQHPG